MALGDMLLSVNGKRLPFARQANPYRAGGVEVSMAPVRELLTDTANNLEIRLR
jgi:hypothetical protein